MTPLHVKRSEVEEKAADADEQLRPMQSSGYTLLRAPLPTQATKGELEMSGPASTLSESPTMALNNSLAVAEPRSLSSGKERLLAKNELSRLINCIWP